MSDDPKAHRRCLCEFSSGGVYAKICAFHDRLFRVYEAETLYLREDAAKMVDHILKEGGGTYGDAIRALKVGDANRALKVKGTK